MSRTDYVIVHNTNVNLENLLKDKLKEAVENSYGNIVEDEVFSNALKIRYTKNFSDNAERSLSGFSINLDIFIGENNTQEIVASFSDIISTAQDNGIIHVIKFYDDNLHQDNAKLAEELFEVEMKSREIFSVIFIDTEEDNFYKLIKDTSVIPMGDPQLPQMQSRYENEFFYLTFSQYKSLNEKKAITNVPQIIQLIRSSTDFQVFQENFLHSPIQKT